MDKETLKSLLEDDEFGLLNVKPKSSPISENDRLINGFEEINKFIDDNKREPSLNNSDILEKSLYYRLEGIKENNKKSEALKDYDRHNIIKAETKEVNSIPKSISDIMDDDEFCLLSSSNNDIFNVRPELIKQSSRGIGSYDYIAKRKKCLDFDKFEQLFKSCQSDLSQKKRFLKNFETETSIKEGTFFVFKGVLMYIDKVGDFSERNQRMQARLRCIYENGTESSILRNSLAKMMYNDGKIVTENINSLLDGFSGIEKDDVPSGYIYVLKSLSRDPNIRSIKDLYKIGYTEGKVEDRIRNAINEPTYLMSKVKIVATYKMYNVNTQKFEDLIHTFFKHACIAIDVIDNSGIRKSPKEWFQIPFEVIQQAILLLQSGEIINYRYSRETKSIVEIDK